MFNFFLENQSKAYLKMKKKREAKRQAKQNQEDSNIDNNTVHKTTEPIDNEIQLKIKKIQSVCFSKINYYLLYL